MVYKNFAKPKLHCNTLIPILLLEERDEKEPAEEEEPEDDRLRMLVEGRVVDTRGRPLPGTTIRFLEGERRRRIRTDTEGNFDFARN